jgi:hypothetical protein
MIREKCAKVHQEEVQDLLEKCIFRRLNRQKKSKNNFLPVAFGGHFAQETVLALGGRFGSPGSKASQSL